MCKAMLKRAAVQFGVEPWQQDITDSVMDPISPCFDFVFFTYIASGCSIALPFCVFSQQNIFS